MKFRQSGMPEEGMWKEFFNPEEILKVMKVDDTVGVLLDVGCGYGTFLIPAAKIVNRVIGIDIDDEMIQACRKKLKQQRLENAELLHWDISKEENHIETQYIGTIDYICLFNILHCESPTDLLKIAKKVASPGGKIGVIHWNYEDTPRGPSMDIRPTPEKIANWANAIHLHKIKQVALPPYHYGLLFEKREE